MTAAMILAAGFGTRLRPLTDELPKPLVWVGDRPLVAHIADRLAQGGVEAAAINVHHRAGDFTQEVLAALPLRLTVLHEPEILGTAGGVANAAAALGEGEVVVWNGDILIDLEVRALVDEHRRSFAAATLAVAPRAPGQGTVGVGARGEVVRLRGERFGEEVAGGDFVGVQVVSPAIRRLLPAQGCLVGDGHLPWLRQGGAVQTFPAPSEWDDVGTVGAYLRANARWLARAGRSAHVGAGTTVEGGVEVLGSVVGTGARVTGQGTLHGCVVWPGATAEAPLAGAVVTPGGLMVRAG